jgi:hypothetical protein
VTKTAISEAARALASIRTPKRAAAARANAKQPRPTRRRWIYAAIAQHDGMNAGHVCYGLSPDDARIKARAKTNASFVVRREAATAEQVEELRKVGKL